MSSDATINKWKSDLARGHTSTWLATFITLWAVIIVVISWWLVGHENKATKFILAGIAIYMIL